MIGVLTDEKCTSEIQEQNKKIKTKLLLVLVVSLSSTHSFAKAGHPLLIGDDSQDLEKTFDRDVKRTNRAEAVSSFARSLTRYELIPFTSEERDIIATHITYCCLDQIPGSRCDFSSRDFYNSLGDPRYFSVQDIVHAIRLYSTWARLGDIAIGLEAVNKISSLASGRQDSAQVQMAAVDAFIDIMQHARPSTQGQNPYFRPALNAIEKLSGIYGSSDNPELKQTIVNAMAATAALDTSPEIFEAVHSAISDRH